MKKIISTCILLLISFILLNNISLAQTSSKNYVANSVVQVTGITTASSVDALPYSTDNGKIKTVTYYDALGRPEQEIQCNASPYNNYNIINFHYYDDLGRESRSYLPYTSGVNGNYDYYPYLHQDEDYTDSKPYGYSDFDNSPLNRVVRQYGPGEAWHANGSDLGHPVANSYITNRANEVLDIDIVNDNPEIIGYFQEGMLTGIKITNENGPADQSTDNNSAIEFKDKKGNIILKESFDGNKWLKTYYVYDEYNLLRFVIPPLAVQSIKINYEGNYDNLTFTTILSGMTATINSYVGVSYLLDGPATLTIRPTETSSFSFIPTSTSSFVAKQKEEITPSSEPINELCYCYKYDYRQRMIEKKLPGADPVYMIYDVRDRLVATQDGELRKTGKWLITKYDALDRPVITALKVLGTNRIELQNSVNLYTSDDALNVRLDMSAGTHIFHYVCNSGLGATLAESEVQTINYYDGYFGLDAGYSSLYISDQYLPNEYKNISTTYTNRTQGLLTINKVKNIETGNFLTTVSYYDEKGRVIRTVADNNILGKDVFMNKLDFTGRIIVTNHKQSKSSSEVLTEGQRFTYDHVGRLLNTYHVIAYSGSEKLISSNSYDHIGQLIQKKVGNNLQTIDFSYNIRGWLQKINDPTNLGSDLFGEEMYYENLDPGATDRNVTNLNCPVNYNGNISAITWIDAKKNVSAAYGYSYDNVNRLKKAQSGIITGETWGVDNKYSVPTITYDLNGNITSLKRLGSAGSYIDQLTYTYINNGNRLAKVEDAAITEGFNNGNTSGNDYSYDANGNAIKDLNKGIGSIAYNYLNLPKTVTKGSQTVNYQYSTSGQKLKESYYNGSSTVVTDYINNFVYVDNALKYILTDEGRINVNGGTYTFEYWLKDHLGNTRVTFADDVAVNGVIDPTTEINQVTDYYPFGMEHANTSNIIDAGQKYLYNGKEKQDMTNWLDYGARMYDPQLGRFHRKDPLAEWHFKESPYSYCYNNPLRYIDPTGMEGEEPKPYTNPPPSKPEPLPNPFIPVPEVVVVGHGTPKPSWEWPHPEWGLIFYGEGGHDGTNPDANGIYIDIDLFALVPNLNKNLKYKKKTPDIESTAERIFEASEGGTPDEKIGEESMGTGPKLDGDGKPIDDGKSTTAQTDSKPLKLVSVSKKPPYSIYNGTYTQNLTDSVRRYRNDSGSGVDSIWTTTNNSTFQHNTNIK